MAKNLKLSLIAILSVLGIFQLQAQNTPKINGVSGGISIGGLHDFQSKFVATGCPNGYDWTFKTAKYFGTHRRLANDFCSQGILTLRDLCRCVDNCDTNDCCHQLQPQCLVLKMVQLQKIL